MHLKVGYQCFDVEFYIGTPWQCYRYQVFGHNVEHCHFKPQYLVCSGPHEFRKCFFYKRELGPRVIDFKWSRVETGV